MPLWARDLHRRARFLVGNLRVCCYHGSSSSSFSSLGFYLLSSVLLLSSFIFRRPSSFTRKAFALAMAIYLIEDNIKHDTSFEKWWTSFRMKQQVLFLKPQEQKGGMDLWDELT